MKPVHPGVILRHDFLEPTGMSPYRLARHLDVSAPTVNDIARGRRAVTAEMALRFAHFWSTSPQFWLNLQAQFDLAKVEAKQGSAIRRKIRLATRDAA
ncbi:MAG: addiction module antidote protein, HigA family [Gammaproteobacteria bacterium]|nr:addiction module antidote protein, HigA family [Gammaproteobacteria bacterium]